MRIPYLVSLLTALAVAGSHASAWAQSWIPIGAPGGNVRALAADPRDPRRIYLGTSDGLLYRSDNGGLQWQRLGPELSLRGCSLDEVVVNVDGEVFVGYREVNGDGGGVSRSTDGGRTFTVLGDVDGQSVRALALAPSDSRVIAAGTRTGVLLSTDGGRHWKRITPEGHADLRNIESLAFDPTDSKILYAGTWHLVWKTLDGGATWMSVPTGMIDDSDVMTLTVDPRDPQTVYSTACTGIYRSTDGAMEWTKLPGIPFSSRRTRAFSQGGEYGDLLVAGTTEGLWISEDRGGAWARVTPQDLIINALLVQPDGAIIVGTEGAGVLQSSDLGRTWTATNTGFSERFVSRLLFDAAGRRLLVAVWGTPRYGGVFASSGVRGPWIRLGTGLDGRQVLALDLLGDTILAGTDDGIFAWAPGAVDWTRLPTRLGDRDLHPRVTGLLALPGRRLLAATSNRVIRSLDGGRTWTRPALGSAAEITDLTASPIDPDLVLAATELGIFRSRDGGKSWRRISAGVGRMKPHALVFMPTDDRVLFTTTSGGLFRSGDQGVSWRRVDGGIPHADLTGIAIHPDGRTIYVSDFTWGGVYRSIDGGLKWARMPTDGLGSDRVWTLGLDPASPDSLLAASLAGGLHLLVPAAAGEPIPPR